MVMFNAMREDGEAVVRLGNKYVEFSQLEINQLPVSATRWQQGSKICFATFIQWKITTSTTTKVREKKQIWNH